MEWKRSFRILPPTLPGDFSRLHPALRAAGKILGTVKYYAQIHLQFWQNSVCTGQGNLPLIT